MQIMLNGNRPQVEFGIREQGGGFVNQLFLVDTGFTGNCLFLIRDMARLKEFAVYDMEELPEAQWITFGDGRKLKAFRGLTEITVNGLKDGVEVLLAMTNDKEEFIIGVDFLRQKEKTLVLDFKNKVFDIT